MMKVLAGLGLALAALARSAAAQELPARWDELTAADWPRAMEKSAATIILPIGILEKHGPHAPMGSDLIHVREWSARATKREYAVVFPDFFYGQIKTASRCATATSRCAPGSRRGLPWAAGRARTLGPAEIGRRGGDAVRRRGGLIARESPSACPNRHRCTCW